ncbi:uncharacterized protein PpBr36_10272 [Pyricularia pennisetigena]|uniref:uncharacterized protein n=1 Tax=Pyricularia pennisetigena TaxID=1578925 RepID=UPI001152FE42|nr:uncharacterized protein PpBr36_10272 [Pyricularia pennisetigena]TLS21529.1 hypothetical protein PpBr36_10272 [Pyricularia pennisetigena]
MQDKVQVYQLRPLGWENDQEEERIPATIFDYTVPMSYNAWAIYFRLDRETSRPKVVKALKAGLERTLSQCRQLVGRLELDPTDDGNYSFVKRKDDTVDFIVEYWDDVDVPSFDQLQNAHFASCSLGDVGRFGAPGMECGHNPACRPENANFIPGGLIFVMTNLHVCQDVMGWYWSARQLADNCFAAVNDTAPPAWDPAAISDGDRFTPRPQKVERPVEKPQENLSIGSVSPKPASSLLFHLSKSKARDLKSLAAGSRTASSDASSSWISTYDAFVALIWRTLTKHRRGLYPVQDDQRPLLTEAINLRFNNRLSPPVAKKYQRNLLWSAKTTDHPSQFTVAQVAETEPLGNLAARIRHMTSSVTQPVVEAGLAQLALRDRAGLARNIGQLPALTSVVTDWRRASLEGCDFGFGRPSAFRCLSRGASTCMVIVFPPRVDGSLGEEEGPEVAISIENELVHAILHDDDFTRYFEFRGYEVRHKDLV